MLPDSPWVAVGGGGHVPGPRAGDWVDEDRDLVARPVLRVPLVVIVERVELVIAEWLATGIVIPDCERDWDQGALLITADERHTLGEAEGRCEGA